MTGAGLRPVLRGAVAGIVGGLVYGIALVMQPELAVTSGMSGLAAAQLGWPVHLALSVLAGIGFHYLCGRYATTAGAALMWGASYGLLWWVAVPLTLAPLVINGQPDWNVEAVRAAFPLLVGLVTGYGAVLGLVYLALNARASAASRRASRESGGRPAQATLESLAIGGLAGLVGGLAFGAWMEQANFFPLVAGLVRSDSAGVGRALHFAISVVIGASFGVLFQRDVRSVGSSVAWGMAYGLLWWLLGALTLLPALLGLGVQWSPEAAQAAFPSLVGHVVYGILLGVVYAVVAKAWRVLFVESDPLQREPEGPGARSLRALGIGVLASVAGGLVFTIVMVQTGVLPVVASLVGGSTAEAGFVVHMAISAIVGATFGLLFQRDAYTYGAGLAWGLVYGLVWWFLGPLTLMPILLGAGIQWSLEAAVATYPSLIGHLGYGAATALVFWLLAQHYDPGLRPAAVTGRVPRGQRRADTPAPALWVLVLTAGVTLPIVLGAAGPGQAAPGGAYGATGSPYGPSSGVSTGAPYGGAASSSSGSPAGSPNSAAYGAAYGSPGRPPSGSMYVPRPGGRP
jgi:uncharacterized membrane protein YagU involved in acid resistance